MKEYMEQLNSKKDKDSRIKYGKIWDCINVLRENGVAAGEPYIKHLYGELWELRPIRDRILFVAWNGDGFIFLSRFLKQTQKTPQREIERALRYLRDYRERYDENEKH